MIAPVPIHPVESWRRSRGITQEQMGNLITASGDLIYRIESGLPVRQKYWDRLKELGVVLQPKYIITVQPRKGTNGKGKRKRPGKSSRKAGRHKTKRA